MTEKTLKHELYKHGSYLISLKESGSAFVNIDDEIKKLEELFQLASKKDNQPTFEVGEYYSSENGKKVFKILGNIDDQIEYCVYDVPYGTLKKWYIPEKDMLAIFPDSIPATAEEIATFKRAEHFASKGRKLDEFQDRDLVEYEGELFFAKTTSEPNLISVSGFDGYGWEDMNADEFDLIQTAEELKGDQL